MQNTFVFGKDAGKYVQGQLLFYDKVAHHYYHPHSQNFATLSKEEENALIPIKHEWELKIDAIQENFDARIEEIGYSLTTLNKKIDDIMRILNFELDDGK